MHLQERKLYIFYQVESCPGFSEDRNEGNKDLLGIYFVQETVISISHSLCYLILITILESIVIFSMRKLRFPRGKMILLSIKDRKLQSRDAHSRPTSLRYGMLHGM